MKVTGNFSRISKQVGNLEGATRDAMRDVLQESVDTGADVMRDVVKSSGTNVSWRREWKNPPWGNAVNGRTGSFGGRIATGKMLDTITSQVDKDSKYRVRGRFGWLRGSKPYMAFQDQGFRHVLSGQYIEGMQAVRQGEEEAEIVFQTGAERVAKAIIDWKL